MFGLFGDTARSLTDNAFFQWFQFVETETNPQTGQILYRPSGDAFRSLTSLAADIGPQDKILSLVLTLDRDFIEDPRQGPFARDLVKSFLEGLAQEGGEALRQLATEIFFRGAGVLARGPGPQLSDAPSEGYAVYDGSRSSWSANSSAPRVSLENRNSASGAVLVVEARA